MTENGVQSGQATPRVLSLCDRTGNMVRPWAEAGYHALAVDVAHDGTHLEDVGAGAITYVEADVRDYEPPEAEYAAAFAFPPCTDLAYSGAKHFDEKGWEAFGDALALAGRCRDIVDGLDCPWMVENPKSRLQHAWGDPDWRFDPYEYDGYTDADEAYTKRTWLWTSSTFRMPLPDGVKESAADDRIHTMSPGEDRQERRSATPTGFARAVYLAHQEPAEYAHPRSATTQQNLEDLIA